MIDLRFKIREIIENEYKNNHFSVLDFGVSVELIQQIFNNYEITHNLNQDKSDLPKHGELIFIAAPTGTGKDTLVRKLNCDNPEKNYIELNMDIFRQYFYYFLDDPGNLNDKKFAYQTNQFSYEIYYTIQELLLNEFPGTNVIITGTLREVDWVENVFRKFKENRNTNYTIKLVCLAVPKKESSFSIIQRYIGIVDTQTKRNDFIAGTARYTDLQYHNDTFDRFMDNFIFLEQKFKDNPGELIDMIEVYRRVKNINDLSEDTKEYSSDDSKINAEKVIKRLREKKYEISSNNMKNILKLLFENSRYLKSQDTLNECFIDLLNLFEAKENITVKAMIFDIIMEYSKILKLQNTLEDIIRDLAIFLEYPKIIERLNKLQYDKKINNEEQNLF